MNCGEMRFIRRVKRDEGEIGSIVIRRRRCNKFTCGASGTATVAKKKFTYIKRRSGIYFIFSNNDAGLFVNQSISVYVQQYNNAEVSQVYGEHVY